MVTRHTQICVDEQELDEFKAELAQLRERHDRAVNALKNKRQNQWWRARNALAILEGTDQ